jgi:hypothetical protein
MWMIRVDERTPVLIAKFDGFVYAVPPKSSKGYRDVVIGGHLGGGMTALEYFRLDGTTYRSIGGAMKPNVGEIVPDTPR